MINAVIHFLLITDILVILILECINIRDISRMEHKVDELEERLEILRRGNNNDN